MMVPRPGQNCLEQFFTALAGRRQDTCVSRDAEGRATQGAKAEMYL